MVGQNVNGNNRPQEAGGCGDDIAIFFGFKPPDKFY